MPHYTPAQIDAANRTDIAAFLISRGETLKRIGQQYLWEARQVWIHRNEWYTHYDGKGGHTVRFVMAYYNLNFQDAIKELLGISGDSAEAVTLFVPKEKVSKTLVLPAHNQTMNRVYAYLINERFIDREVISFFAHEKTLYEDSEYHNAVFIGLDENGIPRHCHRRSTNSTGQSFKCTEAGSDCRYAFHHIGTSECLYVFEAPIDMLAFITLRSGNWQKHSYVALCSVAEHAMLHQLGQNPHLKKVILCLDNDEAGRTADQRLTRILTEHGYTDVSILKPENKDWDEDLKKINGRNFIPAAETQNRDKIRELCHMYILEAQKARRPPLLFEKVKAVFTSIQNPYNRKKQSGKLLVLLLLLAKDECRKCRADISWEEIERRLVSTCESKTGTLDINRDMRKLFDFYTNRSIDINSELFLNLIFPVCADCVSNLELTS
jgi:5S rRNA maturation endonuclease (ribonuclease M5)